MDKHILPKFLITIIAISCVIYFSGSLFAQEEKDELSLQAKSYREAGLENQRIGNLPEAMSLYQKAIAVDSGNVDAHNDLGVVYEALGYPKRAEESYLKALKIDPAYASAYTNLALLYENQRNLEKAAFYWKKRVQIGFTDDPWTIKAASRLRDIRIVLSKQPIADLREEEVLGLMKDVAADRTEFNKDDNELAHIHFKKAKESFKRGDLATAIKEALDAQYLDQDNPEIEAFIEKAERRALSQ